MQIWLSILLWATYILSLYFSVFWFLVFFDGGFDFKPRRRKVTLRRHPLVSVIIPAFNEETTVIPTIQSVLNLNYPRNRLQIIIVNDGSTDTTLKKIRAFEKTCKFLRTGELIFGPVLAVQV